MRRSYVGVLVCAVVFCFAVFFVAACGEDDGGQSAPVQSTEAAIWGPGVVYRTMSTVRLRGMLDLRGLIHTHSVYSHDACDNHPVVNGVRDPVCFEDLR